MPDVDRNTIRGIHKVRTPEGRVTPKAYGKLPFSLYKRRTGPKTDNSERTYFMDDPLDYLVY